MSFTRSIAVVIGIDKYRNNIPTLSTAENDARSIGKLLAARYGFEVVADLTSGEDEVSLERLKELLTVELPTEVGKDDRLILYFAGHGLALDGDDGPAGYLVPQDSDRTARGTLLPMHDVHQWLTDLPCRHALIILDCCFAGAFRWSGTRQFSIGPEVLHRERYERYLKDDAWLVLTSAAHNEEALDVVIGAVERPLGRRDHNDRQIHSPFAELLLRGLSGDADILPVAQDGQPGGNGVITAHELFAWLQFKFTEDDHLQQAPVLWSVPQRHKKGEFVFVDPDRQPLEELPPAPVLDESTNPWRWPDGYQTTETDAGLFFGRDDFIAQLRVRIDEPSVPAGVTENIFDRHALTVVVGPSGSGKSSVVRAGLLMRLTNAVSQTELGPLRYHVCPVIRPTESPLAALQQLKLAERPEGQTLADQIESWFCQNDVDRLVIVIDQFEEVLTAGTNEDERNHFFRQLEAALDRHETRLRIVLTLRSDFEPLLRGLVSVHRWSSAVIAIPAMKHDELREVIEHPASACVLYFNPPDFVDRLIRDVLKTPGALPLLSFALTELYRLYLERHRQGDSDDRCLLETDYIDFGGVSRVLQNRADKELRHFEKKGDYSDGIMRNVLLRMATVRAGRSARRRVPKQELEYPTAADNEKKENVIDRLREAMLVVSDTEPDGTPVFEPAHDELILGWSTFQTWLDDPKVLDQLRLRDLIAPKLARWAPENGGVLWDWQELSDLQADQTWLNRRENLVVAASLEKRRKQWFIAVLSRCLLVTIPVVAFILVRFLDSQATATGSRKAAATANQEGRVNEAVSLAAGSLTHYDHPDARRLIVETPVCALYRRLHVEESAIECLSFDPTGRSLYAGADDGQLVRVDLRDGTPTTLGSHTDEVDALQISPDGSRIISSNSGNELWLWKLDKPNVGDLANRIQLDLRYATSSEDIHFFEPAFSPDGQLVIARLPSDSEEGLTGVWDAENGFSLPPIPLSTESVFSPDGMRLIIQQKGSDGLDQVALYDLTTRTSTPGWRPQRSGADLAGGGGDMPGRWAFANDGIKLAAAASFGTSIWILDTSSFEDPLEVAETLSMRQFAREVAGHEIKGISYDRTGQWLIAASSLNTVAIWNADHGDIRNVLQVPNELEIRSFAVSPACDLIAVGCNNGEVYIWEFSGFPDRSTMETWQADLMGELFPYPGRDTIGRTDRTDEVEVAMFEAGDESLLAGFQDGSVRRYSTSTGRLEVMQPSRREVKWEQGHDGWVLAIGVCNDDPNSLFTIGSGDICIRNSADLSVKLRIDREHEIMSDQVYAVGLACEGTRAAINFADGTTRIVDLSVTGPIVVDEFSSKEGSTHESITFLQNGEAVLLTDKHKSNVMYRDIREHETQHYTIAGFDDREGIEKLTASPLNDIFVSPSPDSTNVAVVPWRFDPVKGLIKQQDLGVGSWPLEFSPDGNWLAYGGDNDSIVLYDMVKARQAATLRFHAGQLEGLVFSTDSRKLASFGMDANFVVHDLAPLLSDVETIIDRTESLTGLTVSGETTVAMEQLTESAERTVLEQRVWQQIETFNKRRDAALGDKSWAEWWAEQHPEGAAALATLRRSSADEGN